MNKPLIKAVSSLMLTGTSLGFVLGKAASPVYDDPHHPGLPVVNYLARHAERSGDELTFKCGATFVYNVRDKMVTALPESTPEAYTLRRAGLTFNDSVMVFAGSLSSFPLSKTLSPWIRSLLSSRDPEQVGPIVALLAGVAGLSSGVAVGLYYGYRDDPHCETHPFQEALLAPPVWELADVTLEEAADRGHAAPEAPSPPPDNAGIGEKMYYTRKMLEAADAQKRSQALRSREHAAREHLHQWEWQKIQTGAKK